MYYCYSLSKVELTVVVANYLTDDGVSKNKIVHRVIATRRNKGRAEFRGRTYTEPSLLDYTNF